MKRLIRILLLLVLLSSFASAPAIGASVTGGDTLNVGTPSASVPFAAVKTYQTGSLAVASAVAEVTGDGRNDVLMTTGSNGHPATDGKLIVFPQKSDGSLGTPVKYTYHRGGEFSGWDLAVGDFSAALDGLADALVVAVDGLNLFEQQGGHFVGPTVIGGLGHPLFAEPVDVDLDGRLDVVVASDNGLYVVYFLPAGTQIQKLSSNPQGEIEVADLSGDGLSDILGCESCTGSGFDVWVQQGGGSFLKQPYELGDLQTWQGLAAGDVTGDGRADVALTHYYGGVEIWPQTEVGTLGPPIDYLPGYGPVPVLVADLDGDGRGEIVGDVGYFMTIYRQLPDGTPDHLCYYFGLDPYFGAPKSMSVGDVTGDGLLDVVDADFVSSTLAVFAQVPTGTSSLTVNATPASITLGDTVTISGAATIPNGGCVPESAVVRIKRTDSEGSHFLPDALMDDEGAFSIDDVPTVPGDSTYTVSWSGDTRHTGASGQSSVDVQKVGSSMTIVAEPDSIRLGESATLSGVVLSDDGLPVGIQPVHVLRTDPDGSQTQLPDALTDAMGNYSFIETPPTYGEYVYDATWDGDDTHTGASAQTTLGVSAGTGVSDFNGDGTDDLAVGIPWEDTGSYTDTGAASVLEGAPAGLVSARNQFWDQAGTGASSNGNYDGFGFASASGDFDGDGFTDLAASAPGKGVGFAGYAGALNVLYGSPAGLATGGSQQWTQDSTGVEEVAEDNDFFGWSLAAGDLNGDGFADLAIGVPGEIVAGKEFAGGVNVLYGSALGLTSSGNQFWTQDSPNIEGKAETDDQFGLAVGIGDFDGNGYSDLAVGAPTEDLTNGVDGGAVNLIYGSSGGLTSVGDDLWHQDVTDINNKVEDDDWFGYQVAGGDFDGNGFDDLLIGVPEEDLSGGVNAGMVNVIYGSASGLTAVNDDTWQQDSVGINNQAEAGDEFGLAVAAGDFDADGYEDAAIGAPSEDLTGAVDGGGVAVIYGTSVGLDDPDDDFWYQNSSGIEDDSEPSDLFGFSLVTADFGNGPEDDLGIGVVLETVGSVQYAGAVNVIYGSPSDLTVTGNQFWSQDSIDILDQAEYDDEFGYGLAQAGSGGAYALPAGRRLAQGPA